MTQPPSLRVAAPGSASVASLLRPVMTSLPLSLRAADDPADLALVSGTGWIEEAHAAIRKGARGILVLSPDGARPDLAAALRDTAAERGVGVVLDMPWTGHPAVADAIAAWQPSAAGATLVDSFVSSDLGVSIADLALAQLYLLQAVVGRLDDLEVDHLDGGGYAMRARTAEGTPVSIAATTAGDGEASATVRILSLPALIEIAVRASATWRPGLALRADVDGELRRPPIFESSHRAAWKRLRDAVASSSSPDDLDRLIDVATLLHAAGSTAA